MKAEPSIAVLAAPRAIRLYRFDSGEVQMVEAPGRFRVGDLVSLDNGRIKPLMATVDFVGHRAGCEGLWCALTPVCGIEVSHVVPEVDVRRVRPC